MKKSYKTWLLPTLVAGTLLAGSGMAGIAGDDDDNGGTGGDASAYLVGHWKLNDSFQDFKGGYPISTENTEFVFLNPTKLTLTLEYAFFATNGDKSVTFCGCDRDTLNANGRVRYTMLGEQQGGQFSTKLCPTQTDGTMKTIVFTSKPREPVKIDSALQAGYQIDIFGKGSGRTEAGLLSVPITDSTRAEIQNIHQLCNKFIKK